jgi:serine protease Do
MRFCLWLLCGVLLMTVSVSAQEKKTRDQKVREDLEKVTSEGFWIYNNLPAAFEKAKATGKPILVVLRCIPCEECVKLDDELVDRDPVLRPLMEQFVCVRVVSTNGLDLSLFQFDTDQSFAVFMLNADRTIYGRFGTRSHRTEWVGDVSLKGLAQALEGALELHREYPANREQLVGKTGSKPLFDRPELFPSLKEANFTDRLNYSGDVVKSCIHCHQIGDAVRDFYRSRNEPIPDHILNPYPHPKSVGLILDPHHRSLVKSVTPDSAAEAAGFRVGDEILSLNQQPILSTADVQWVLHNTPTNGGVIPGEIRRGQKNVTLNLSLESGWRLKDDISWRVSTWGLRRMTLGGLRLEPVDASERGSQGIPDNGMALRVTHVGQYGAHAAAKNAGFQKDDVLVSFDGRTDLLTDADVLRYGVTNRTVGEKVPVEVIRSGNRVQMTLPMQK